jgi:hypothetical protein
MSPYIDAPYKKYMDSNRHPKAHLQKLAPVDGIPGVKSKAAH